MSSTQAELIARISANIARVTIRTHNKPYHFIVETNGEWAAAITVSSWRADTMQTIYEKHHCTHQRGRKWLVDPMATDQQILNTMLMALLAFEEHELREGFTVEQDTPTGWSQWHPFYPYH